VRALFLIQMTHGLIPCEWVVTSHLESVILIA